jgi:hypothetical protein
VYLNHFAYVAGGYRVPVGTYRHQAVAGHDPHDRCQEFIRGLAPIAAQLFLREQLRQLAERGAMDPLIRHGDQPVLYHGIHRLLGREGPPLDEAPVDILMPDSTLPLVCAR